MQRVEIQIKDHLDVQWMEWLDGFCIAYLEQGGTILSGEVQDQAALYGLMAKLRDLGVKLVAVNIEWQGLNGGHGTEDE